MIKPDSGLHLLQPGSNLDQTTATEIILFQSLHTNVVVLPSNRSGPFLSKSLYVHNLKQCSQAHFNTVERASLNNNNNNNEKNLIYFSAKRYEVTPSNESHRGGMYTPSTMETKVCHRQSVTYTVTSSLESY
jgi:hypothetical protein